MTRVLGVLNVTPDSFSDGGRFVDLEAAVARAREMMAQGAHLVDVGGESTRPGAEAVSGEVERQRVIPVVEALAAEGIPVSIDTVRADTARAAVAAGASIINDVSGGLHDPGMYRVAAETGAGYIAMHWRGIPDPGHSRSDYGDVVAEVREQLARLAEAAIAAGVPAERVMLDPGLGFDKTAEQGWRLLAQLPRLSSLGYPVIVGASRKRMLGETLGEGSAMADRDLATAVVSALAAREGAWGVRAHEVAPTVNALAVARAWDAASDPAVPSDGDRITLRGLEVFAHHGVFDFERREGQRFVVDVDAAVDLRAASGDDDLSRTVNYAELAEAVSAAVQRDPVDLIETVAERVASVTLGFDGVAEARVTVHKPDAPIGLPFDDVSVTVVRRAGAPEVGERKAEVPRAGQARRAES